MLKYSVYCALAPSLRGESTNSLISLADVILQRRNVVKCVQFTGQWTISQKLNDICNKMLRLALEYIDKCRSRVSFIAFSCLDGQILVQRFAKIRASMKDHSYKV